MIVAKVVSAADMSRTPHDGRYVVAWNSNVPFGMLALESTADKTKAKQFKSVTQVLEEWKARSEVQRNRPTDGLPNRPLMAVHVVIENA